MNEIRAIQPGDECEQVRAVISSVFVGSEPTDFPLFADRYSLFAILSPYMLMEASNMLSIRLPDNEEGRYLGYLTALQQGRAPIRDGARVCPAYLLSGAPSQLEVQATLDSDSGLVDEGPLGSYVRSGFFVPKKTNPQAAIWYSTFWEIALVGFSDHVSALSFRASNVGTVLFTSQMIEEEYIQNPDGLSALRYYLERNVLN